MNAILLVSFSLFFHLQTAIIADLKLTNPLLALLPRGRSQRYQVNVLHLPGNRGAIISWCAIEALSPI